MAVDSEAIWAALHARLVANTTGFTTLTRRRRYFTVEELPALITADDQGDEILLDDSAPQPQWRLTGEIVVVVKTQPSDADSTPTHGLNDFVKNVREALERKSADAIGMGLSHYTDLSGAIDSLAITRVEKGIQDNQSVAVITVEMETNPA